MSENNKSKDEEWFDLKLKRMEKEEELLAAKKKIKCLEDSRPIASSEEEKEKIINAILEQDKKCLEIQEELETIEEKLKKR